MTSGDQESTLVASWSANADRWREAIASGVIAGRKLVTDGAIVEAILAERPRTARQSRLVGRVARRAAAFCNQAAGFAADQGAQRAATRSGASVVLEAVYKLVTLVVSGMQP